ncbi:hypothetical protein IFM89_013562, partial [Coptis chinensis]
MSTADDGYNIILFWLQEFSTKNKLLITSTQLQNSVDELCLHLISIQISKIRYIL